jgi:two-component system OmpR family sensor kinase
MSIRLRLTLLYSVLLALTLTLFGFALYVVQAHYTLRSHRRDLALQARGIAIGVARTFVDPVRRAPRPGSPFSGRLDLPEEQEFRELRSRDTVRLLDRDGDPIPLPTNQDTDPLPLSEPALQAALAGKSWAEMATVDGERLLVYSQPVILQNETVGIVQIARSMADRDRSLRALGIALIAGTLVTTVAAFGIGWVLSGITLRPIERMTQTAQAIGAERDLSQRIPYSGPDDEVGQLAATLNAMLAELEDAYQQVEQALDLQRNFVADVSHELRTPLTTLRGNLALLARQPPIAPGEREDILGDMVDESERLIRLVNDLLALARAEAGQQLTSERVAIAPLIEDVCRQARLLDPGRSIICDPVLDVAVTADRNALRQLLLTLLDNAILHGEGAIRVATHLSSDSKDSCLAIHIQDRGPGIDADTLSHLFERFARGQAARSKRGLGLGLPIAKALAESQEGTLTVESKVGRGSTFTITLPLHP